MPDSGECWSRVYELLEIETRLVGLDPEAAKLAHFFGVATYQLQHASRSTADALTHLRTQVAVMVRPDPPPIESMCRGVGRLFDKSKVPRRSDPSNRTHVDPRSPSAWTVTAVDVISAPDHEYPASVAAWARATLADLDAAMPAR